MTSSHVLITNISRLVTMTPGPGREGALGVIPDAACRIEGDHIAWVGKQCDLPKSHTREEVFDVEQAVVMPGLIDCHTHLVHGGSRQQEFRMRSEGKSYRDIAQEGGGILSTVAATRNADLDELYAAAVVRADEAFARGTLVLEMKSGYGLDLETELKIVEVMGQLKTNHPLRFFATFMGAHTIPREYQGKRNAYVQHVVDDMLPAVWKTGVCSGCDVFVEEGAFTVEEARAICLAAKKLGFKLRLHVDQFSDGGGAELAASVGAQNADHLDFVSDKGITAMKRAGVVGVVLPGATFFTGGKQFPPARKMLDQGLTVAIATDYNPGTNPNIDLWFAATVAVTQMGMTLDEALLAITLNAAKALGIEKENGSIEVGKRADLIVLHVPDEYYPLYRYGAQHTTAIVKKGRPQWVDQYFDV